MTFGIFGNVAKEGFESAVDGLLKHLTRMGVPFVIDRRVMAGFGEEGMSRWGLWARDSDECLDRADLVVAFGGDGTMLGVAREVGARGTPILGVNLGKLGFLAELAPEELGTDLQDLVEGRFQVEDRLVLAAETPALPGKLVFAINDVVVDKSRSPRLIDLETWIDGQFAVTYRGDGLIISTPTGSTAYALSNNGPIVTPTSSVFCITPISPHTLGGRPLVVPDTSVIRILAHSHTNEVMFSADGKVEALAPPPLEVTVRRAKHTVRLVRMPDRSYFDVLRAKLLWGQDARRE